MRLPYRWIAAAALLCAALPGHALFKVVGPDGKVTYTDRPPANEGNAKAVDARGSAAPEPTLPYELRQVVARYPVTLYSADGCAPCQAGRDWLRQRGIPYSERLVSGAEDSQALQAQVGGIDLPGLLIGTQRVRGFSPEEWKALFDAAGYPATSQLPRTYKYPPAAPLTQRVSPAPAAVPATPPPAVAPPPANPSGIRF